MAVHHDGAGSAKFQPQGVIHSARWNLKTDCNCPVGTPDMCRSDMRFTTRSGVFTRQALDLPNGQIT